MEPLTRTDLHSLEAYDGIRDEFRLEVLEHKKKRRVHVGPHATLYFEDRLTIQYQIQEMLRVEGIFKAHAIEEELTTYNAMIPDGGNLKATFMLEYVDADERRAALPKLRGVEDRVWVAVAGHARVFAIADEDLERENKEKTSAVHYLRFELDPDTRRSLQAGAVLSVGIDHDAYRHEVNSVDGPIRDSLSADLAK